MLTRSIIVDRTHLGRRASGLERITEELFSDEALAPLPVSDLRSTGHGRLAVAAAQMVRIPLEMTRRPHSVWAFSGFPPSPLASLFRERCVMYVHDLFLITRQQDLNRAARIYMAYPFRMAIHRLRYFLVNSVATGQALAPYLRSDAVVRTYRPKVRNVFGGDFGRRGPLLALELGRLIGREVQLHIVGRRGWGEDFDTLARSPHVKLHGFLSDERARDVIGTFDLLICTSHDEGLGLPLIEAQYAGLQVVAPEGPVFREVLGSSGVFIDPAEAAQAATAIAALLRDPSWRTRGAEAANDNVLRWNALADRDRHDVIDFLAERLATLS